MPITVNHTPSSAAPALYGAYLAAGQRQFLDKRRAEGLAAAELAQRDLQQQRALAANMYTQAAAQGHQAQQAALDRNFRGGLAQQEALTQQANKEGDWRFRAEEQQWLAQDRDARDNRLLDRQRQMGDELAFRQAEDDRRQFLMKQYEDGQLTLDISSQQRLGKIRSDMNAVRTARHLTPQEQNAKLQELDASFWGILENPSPQLPGERVKPMGQRVKENSFQEPVYAQNPDGSQGAFMGWRNWTEEVRNGEKRFVSSFDAHKPPAAGKAGDNPEKEFIDFSQSFIGKAKPSATGEAKKPYTDKDIWQLWQQQQKLLKRFRGEEKPEAPVHPALEGMPQAAQDYFTRAFPGQFGGQQQPPGGMYPGMDAGMGGVPRGGQPPTAPTAQPQLTNSVSSQQQQAPPSASVPVQEAMRGWVETLPRARSAADAEAAGPGYYVLPDGTVIEVT